MKLSIRLFGLDLLTIEASTDAETEPYDTDRDASGGTLYSTPIGFAPRPETPFEDPGVDYL